MSGACDVSGRVALLRAILAVYMTAEGFVAIGYITGIECILFGRARWLRTKPIGLLRCAPLTFWT